jgi:hypothetical protein
MNRPNDRRPLGPFGGRRPPVQEVTRAAHRDLTPQLRDAADDEDPDSGLNSANALLTELGQKNRQIERLKAELAATGGAAPPPVPAPKPAPADVQPRRVESVAPEQASLERATGRIVLALLKRHGIAVGALAVAGGVLLKPTAAPQTVEGQAKTIATLQQELDATKAALEAEKIARESFQRDAVDWLALLARRDGIEVRVDEDRSKPINDIALESVRMPDPNKPKGAPLWRAEKYLPRKP